MSTPYHVHLVVKYLRLSRLGLGDEGLVQNIQNILAHTLELGLNLLTVITDCSDMFVGALGFLFLLDRGDDAPGSTSSPNDVLVGDR